MYELTHRINAYVETSLGEFVSLAEAMDIAHGCSRVEAGEFIVRGPDEDPGIVLPMLYAVFVDGEELEDCDHA